MLFSDLDDDNEKPENPSYGRKESGKSLNESEASAPKTAKV